MVRPKVKGLSNDQDLPIFLGMDEIIQEMTRQIIYKEEDNRCGKEGRYLPPKGQKSPC
jgi:hypothetical protein